VKGDGVHQKRNWQREPTGLYLNRRGDIRLMIEHVGATFRVLVSRVVGENQADEIVYTGSARNAEDAMMLAERVAEQASARIAA
jgi:hypothetical protein